MGCLIVHWMLVYDLLYFAFLVLHVYFVCVDLLMIAGYLLGVLLSFDFSIADLIDLLFDYYICGFE